MARAAVRTPRRAVPTLDWARIAPRLRGALGTEGDRQVHYLLHRRSTPVIDAYLGREDLDDVSQRGTPTPDHVIRTKRVPLVLELEPSNKEAAAGLNVARMQAERQRRQQAGAVND